MNQSSGRDRGRRAKREFSGFLGALRRDVAGNTFIFAAAFAIPLAALAGSAVDMSRLYLVKVRLQQACDAGVLAGRKVMTQVSGTTLETAPSNAAQDFFKNNLPDGWMSTSGRNLTTARTDQGEVTGTATVQVPMAIMGMFGVGAMTQTVNCTARLDIGDSDIMFVLDVTGSMACATGVSCGGTTGNWTRKDGTIGYFVNEQANSKMSKLRTAVKLFRTTLESSKPAQSHIRYGFVPYSSSVNVGPLIMEKASGAYIANTHVYPSRELADDVYGTTVSNATTTAPASYYVAAGQYNQGDVNYGSTPTAVTTTNISQADCLAKETRRFSTTGTTNQPVGTWPTSGTVTRTLPVWTSASSGTCKTYAWRVKPLWRYANVSLDTSNFKNTYGNGVAGIQDPTKLSAATVKWQGCIEERDTIQSTTSTTYSIASLPADLNPDTVPTTDATRWRPLWPNAVYFRSGTATTYDYGNQTSSGSSDTTTTGAGAALTPLLQNPTGGSLHPNTPYYGCSAPAKRLSEMTATDFDTYLDVSGANGDFRPFGHTYHDVGMIWGLRLISPQGLWAADTQAWGSNSPPNRYIVFMTDGIMDPNTNSYHLYGITKLQGRAAAPGINDTDLGTVHNNRFQAVCAAARAKNITVFVVAFDVGSTVPANLQSCATTGYAYAAIAGVPASDPKSLETAFSRIALQIARLRLSQ